MNILSVKSGHDGSVVFIADGELVFSHEAEKDSFLRHESLHPSVLIETLERLPDAPDVIVNSGWLRDFRTMRKIGAGYYGVGPESVVEGEGRILGRQVRLFSSTHERSHIFCSLGLSNLPPGQPFYFLNWEGDIGSFYRVDEERTIESFGTVVSEPGTRYSFLYCLGNPDINFEFLTANLGLTAPGKLMALAAGGNPGRVPAEASILTDFLLDKLECFNTRKSDLRWTPYWNIGVETGEFMDLAAYFSDQLFDRFYAFAKSKVHEHLPLLIGGGCGLNCSWNSKWRDCGLFSEVFVPPCVNDSGSALGSAVDALCHYTGISQIRWSVYSGQHFLEDDPASDYVCRDLDFDEVAAQLSEGRIFGWANGRAEIGPRALGNRSILAAPFSNETRDRLNRIKQREQYRPVAPICIEEETAPFFSPSVPSPHMLYTCKVTSELLKAVTHVDGSARLQTVSREDNEPIYNLLQAFKARTGVPILCNTSLNFLGCGAINTTSDLIRFQRERGLDGFIIGKRFYTPR